MIKLHCEDYCNDCTEFDVECESLHYGDGAMFILKCAHAEKCERIKAYLAARSVLEVSDER
jgi:hypothetical protein